MARTPLFARFTRAYAQLSRRPARHCDRSRRTVLKGLAGASLSLPFVGATGCSVQAPLAQVAIIGGGLAGLHAAYRLKQRGLDATIYEAAPRLGGRVFTDRTSFPDGQHGELGGELIDTPHQTMIDLAAELDIPLSDYRSDDPALTDTVFLGGAPVSEAALLSGFAPIAKAIDAVWAKATHPGVLPSYRDDNGLGALDQLSISAWLDSIGASGTIRTLLEIAYTVELGLQPDEQSALNLITRIGTAPDHLALFGDSDKRYRVTLGSDACTTRLAARLDSDQVVLEHRLSRIERRSDGRYLLGFDRPAGSRQVLATRVLLTLPFSLLRTVELVGFAWPEPKARAIAELGYGNHTKLLVGFAARPWRSLGATGSSYSDLGYQSSYETSRLQAGASGLLTNLAGGQHSVDISAGTPEKQRDAFLTQIDQVFPGTAASSTGAVARFAWPSYDLTRGSYAAYRVGQWTAFAGAEGERVDNLYFAGEHTSVDAQGSMEGAAITGAMAAEQIADDLGLMQPMRASIPAQRITARAGLALTEGSWLRGLMRRGPRG